MECFFTISFSLIEIFNELLYSVWSDNVYIFKYDNELCITYQQLLYFLGYCIFSENKIIHGGIKLNKVKRNVCNFMKLTHVVQNDVTIC